MKERIYMIVALVLTLILAAAIHNDSKGPTFNHTTEQSK